MACRRSRDPMAFDPVRKRPKIDSPDRKSDGDLIVPCLDDSTTTTNDSQPGSKNNPAKSGLSINAPGAKPAPFLQRLAREAAIDVPRQAVFQTQELVENILVHLPAKTIFGIQRVAKSFRNAVKHSLPIQEKLFLRRRDEPVRLVLSPEYGYLLPGVQLNPLFTPGVKQDPGKIADIYETFGGRVGVSNDRVQISCFGNSSSLLDTYLIDMPVGYMQIRLHVHLKWDYHDSGPSVRGFAKIVRFVEPVTIRTMFNALVGWRGSEFLDEVYYTDTVFRFVNIVVPSPAEWAAFEAKEAEQ